MKERGNVHGEKQATKRERLGFYGVVEERMEKLVKQN